MNAAKEILLKAAPDTFFSIGGGCDADVPVLSYLNSRCSGDLAVLWLDAHGDLNAPWESSTALFYGMPLRALMDRQSFGLLQNEVPLLPSQVVHVGGRDFDKAEQRFMEEANIRRISIPEFRAAGESMAEAIAQTGKTHLYIHLDLDVLDPKRFSHTPLPVSDGLLPEELLALLDPFKEQLIGLGIYEYKPTGQGDPLIRDLIRFGLSL